MEVRAKNRRDFSFTQIGSFLNGLTCGNAHIQNHLVLMMLDYKNGSTSQTEYRKEN